MKWTKRFRERRRDVLPGERVSWPVLVMVALAVFAVGFVYAYPRLARTPLARRDFDGRVVDKFVAFGESQTGSTTHPRLVVETANGARFNVAVSDEMYGRARVGMRLSRHKGELVLSVDEPRLSAPGGEGERMEAR